MTVVNPKSISGITSITTASGSDNLLTIHTSDANNTERLRIDSTGTTKIVTGIVTTLTATTGIVTTLTANTVTSLGAVSGTTGTFSGAVSGTTGTFSAAVSGTTGTFSAAVSGTTGTFSGAVSGTTGTFTGDVDIADKIIHTGDTDTAIRFSGADTITAETGGSERFRIDSSGNITNGGTFTTNNFFSGGIHLKKQSDVGIKFQRTQSGDSQTWDWGVSSAGHLTAAHVGDSGGSSTTKTVFNKNGNLEISDGDLVFGTSGHGIDFSATSDPSSPTQADNEVLNNYEEGTWTPGISGSTSITGHAYTSRNGFYTRIGDRVYCDFSFVLSAKGTISGTYIKIVNLPYAINGSSNTRSLSTPIYFRHLNNKWCFLALQGHEGQSSCYIYGVEGSGSGDHGSTNRSYPDGADISNTTEMTASFSYLAA